MFPKRRPFSPKPPGGPPRPPRPPKGPPQGAPSELREHRTSWEKSADWYDRIIGERGSELYQAVVIPGALKLLDVKRGDRVLDLGCGQGVFCRAMAQKGAEVTGVDASPTLIQKAKTYPVRPPIRYLARDAAHIGDLGEFDALSAILCVQNMEKLDDVTATAARALKPGGRMLWVMNHPAFRIPRQSSWGFEDERKLQYRRHATKARKMTVEEGHLHPEQQSAMTMHNKVRAFAGWPGTRLQVRSGDECFELKVVTTRVSPQIKAARTEILLCSDALELVCGDGSVLELMELQAPGKRVMPARDFWNGLKTKSLNWV